MPSRIKRWSSTTRTRTLSDGSSVSTIVHFLFFHTLRRGIPWNLDKQSRALIGYAFYEETTTYKLQALLYATQTIALLVIPFLYVRNIKSMPIITQAKGSLLFVQLEIKPDVAGIGVLLNIR